jgi:hypothetical protein
LRTAAISSREVNVAGAAAEDKGVCEGMRAKRETNGSPMCGGPHKRAGRKK